MSLPSYNSLLRSAYQIAQRKGKDTNWEAFINSLRKELLIQAGFSEDETNENYILRATVTPTVTNATEEKLDKIIELLEKILRRMT